jgi:restriction endonuclease S subunit
VAKIYFDNHSLDLARAKIFNSLAHEEQVNLFDVIELSSGDYLPKSRMEDGKYKVYGGGGLTQSTHTTSNVDFETIGIGRVGARCGCVFRIEKKSWVTDNALFVSNFKKKYHLGFLIHYLNHINLNRFANQSAQPVISQRGIAKCTIPNIDFYNQQQIGEILDSIESEKDFKDLYNLKPVLKFERKLSLLDTELDQQQAYLQHLRQAILQEAVQGKLTKQEPTDEPATELLKRIKAEKEKLTKAGKLKKEKELSPITEDEIPFELPEGWAWCRFGELIQNVNNGLYKPEQYYKAEGVISLRMYNIQDGTIDFTAAKRVVLSDDEKETYKLEGDDILINRVNSAELVGKAAIIPDYREALVYESMNMRVRLFYKNDLAEYINLYLRTNDVKSYFTSNLKQAISQASINQIQLKGLFIPLPPLAEQQRIVVKVQQLQQQLSQLEAQVQQSRQYEQQLLQSVLKEAFEQNKKASEIDGEISMVAESHTTQLRKHYRS